MQFNDTLFNFIRVGYAVYFYVIYLTRMTDMFSISVNYEQK